jgi:cytidylate kinase
MAIITISRELGSEGDTIADLLCQALGYQRVDKALIAQIAQEAGVNVDAVLAKEQSFSQRPKLVSSDMLSLYNRQPNAFDQKSAIADEAYIQITRKTIEHHADQGNCIIIGRGGQIVLHGRPDALHVHLSAPAEIRAQRLAKRFTISEPEAKRRITESDDEKKRYIAHVYKNADWKDLRFYHLVINTALLSPETATQIIVLAMKSTAGLLAESNSH